jgi:hypothetical protein
MKACPTTSSRLTWVLLTLVKFIITAAVFTSLLAVLLVRSAKPNLPRISRSGCLSSAYPLVSFGNLSANDFVELERHCDFCAVRYRIRPYADGRVEWHGDRGVQAVGDRTARIASSEAQGLIKRFCSAGFWGLCRH